ncbi:hypothetical protein LTR74_016907 [Friedmanniomyces endolithicus]|nr:hypothetical protein LTR74_016907 [Friedmanniomyces endolithicus]
MLYAGTGPSWHFFPCPHDEDSVTKQMIREWLGCHVFIQPSALLFNCLGEFYKHFYTDDPDLAVRVRIGYDTKDDCFAQHRKAKVVEHRSDTKELSCTRQSGWLVTRKGQDRCDDETEEKGEMPQCHWPAHMFYDEYHQATGKDTKVIAEINRIGTYAMLGSGFTLTRAHSVFIMEPACTDRCERQAIGRVSRQQQMQQKEPTVSLRAILSESQVEKEISTA